MTPLANQGQQALDIIKAGFYQSPAGNRVEIGQMVTAAVDGTRHYRPCDFPDDLPLDSETQFETKIEVTKETTLGAAHRLIAELPGDDVLCLNFASAKNPGGGFLGGARAQEESLARSSALYASIAPKQEMYQYNRQLRTCLYSDHMIHSPRVPVFRDDRGELLEIPYAVSFLTAPAVNAGAICRNEPDKVRFIEPVMAARIERLLWVAAVHRHSVLVLGAWGCGVFGNDPQLVAGMFSNALNSRIRGRFARVVFAVYDTSRDERIIEPFRLQFGTP